MNSPAWSRGGWVPTRRGNFETFTKPVHHMNMNIYNATFYVLSLNFNLFPNMSLYSSLISLSPLVLLPELYTHISQLFSSDCSQSLCKDIQMTYLITVQLRGKVVEVGRACSTVPPRRKWMQRKRTACSATTKSSTSNPVRDGQTASGSKDKKRKQTLTLLSGVLPQVKQEVFFVSLIGTVCALLVSAQN